MIAKIVKGSNFRGVVNYILDKGKNAKILVCDGLFAENKETIANSFEAQAKMNPKVTKSVGHIALAFSKEDEHRLTDRGSRRFRYARNTNLLPSKLRWIGSE